MILIRCNRGCPCLHFDKELLLWFSEVHILVECENNVCDIAPPSSLKFTKSSYRSCRHRGRNGSSITSPSCLMSTVGNGPHFSQLTYRIGKLTSYLPQTRIPSNDGSLSVCSLATIRPFYKHSRTEPDLMKSKDFDYYPSLTSQTDSASLSLSRVQSASSLSL